MGTFSYLLDFNSKSHRSVSLNCLFCAINDSVPEIQTIIPMHQDESIKRFYGQLKERQP